MEAEFCLTGARAAGMRFPLPVQSAEAESCTVWRRLREFGRGHARLFSELVAVGERRVGLAMEPPPAEVVLRPTSLYQYPKSRDRKVLGDPESAASNGRTAKYLNIAAVTTTIIVYIIFIIILISSALFIINMIFEIMKLPDEIEEFRAN